MQPARQEARRVDFRLHVREHECDRLLLRDWRAEGPPLAGIVEGMFVRRARDSDRPRCNERPGRLQRLHRAVERGALVGPEQVVFRNAAIVEDDLRGVARADAHLVLNLADLQAWGVVFHDKRSNPEVRAAPVERREDDVDVRDPAIRDEALDAVQDPLVAFLLRRRRDVGDVGAGVGFRDRKSTRLNSSHVAISYAVFCLKKNTTIVPGDPEKSLLIKAVRYTDKELRIPPMDKQLSNEQIPALTSWVKIGAPDHRTHAPFA